MNQWEKGWGPGQNLIKTLVTTNPHRGTPNLSVNKAESLGTPVLNGQLSSAAWPVWGNSGHQSAEDRQNVLMAERQSKI